MSAGTIRLTLTSHHPDEQKIAAMRHHACFRHMTRRQFDRAVRPRRFPTFNEWSRRGGWKALIGDE